MPLVSLLSLSQLDTLWRKVLVPLIYDCPHWAYQAFFGTLVTDTLAAMRDSFACAYNNPAAAVNVDAIAPPTFAALLARVRGPARLLHGATRGGGAEASELLTELEILEDADCADVLTRGLDSLLTLLQLAPHGQRAFDRAVTDKVNAFGGSAAVSASAAVAAAAVGNGAAANALMMFPASPPLALLASDLNATIGFLVVAAEGPVVPASIKAVRVLRALGVAACRAGEEATATAVLGAAERLLCGWAAETAATIAAGADRRRGSSVSCHGDKGVYAEEVCAMLRDLLVCFHGVSRTAVDMALRLPNMTADHVGNLLNLAAGDGAHWALPGEVEKEQKLARALGAAKASINAKTRKQFQSYLTQVLVPSSVAGQD